MLKFRKGLKVFTQIDKALFFQNFYNISYEEKNTQSLAFSNKINMKKHYLAPAINLAGGLNWGSYFHKEKFHIDLTAKYEFMHFWNQNQMRHLLNLLSFTRFNPGALMLQGITIAMRLDF